MNVTRVLHVSVNVNGTAIDPLVAFYRDVVGLGDRARPDIPGIPGHWHHIGDVELHLVGAPGNGEPIDPTGPHFCLAVEDLDGAVAELEERGIPYVRGVQGEGVVQIWFADPAGNTVELQQETRR